MHYKLAKQLKNAGYNQHPKRGPHGGEFIKSASGDEIVYDPFLESLSRRAGTIFPNSQEVVTFGTQKQILQLNLTSVWLNSNRSRRKALARKWMKQSDFATLLNRMGYTRARYGGVLVKKVEHGGDLLIHVAPIIDQVDIRNGPKIERHFYTPADLKEMTKTQAGRMSMKR